MVFDDDEWCDGCKYRDGEIASLRADLTASQANEDAVAVRVKTLAAENAAENAALKELLEAQLPLNGRRECVYCFGKLPPKDFIHPDRDNLWHGDQECLWHSRYEKARQILGIVQVTL